MNHHMTLRGKLIIMISVMASLFLVALDQTIISTALGKIVEEFNAFDSLTWIVTAYLLTTTITVPIAGKLSDLFGRRIMLLIGVAVFGMASLFSGQAESINQLVIWRAVQGIGGGIITANAFTIVGDLFAARERGRWQGLIGAVFALSSVIGPLLGGWLTDGNSLFGMTTSWRWAFMINVPVAIAALAMIAIFCPPLKHAKRPKVDYAGAALLSVALAILVLAVDNTDTIFAGLMDTLHISLVQLRVIMGLIVAAAVAGFIYAERRSDEPVLPMRYFGNRNFLLISGVSLLFGAAFIGAIIYLTQFNQQVFEASPTTSGLMLLPMVFCITLSSIVSGQIITRTGKYKIFMQIGIVIAALMMFALTTLNADSMYWQEAVMMALTGLGMGMIMPVMNVAIQNEFKQAELGVVTSSVQLFRGLGSTIGIATMGAVLTAGLATGLAGVNQNQYVQQLADSPAAERLGDVNDPNTLISLNMPDVKHQISSGFNQEVADLPDPARQQATENFDSQQRSFSKSVMTAFSGTLSHIFILSGILMTVAAVLVFLLKERKLAEALPDATPGEDS